MGKQVREIDWWRNFWEIPTHKKVGIPKLQTAISPLLLDRFGRANMQMNQEEEGFPTEWEIPRSEQLFGKIPKISNGHNSFIFHPNIVVFGLITN